MVKDSPDLPVTIADAGIVPADKRLTLDTMDQDLRNYYFK